MTTRPQPAGIERDLDVLRTSARERAARLAVAAFVDQPGLLEGDGEDALVGSSIALGDTILLVRKGRRFESVRGSAKAPRI